MSKGYTLVEVVVAMLLTSIMVSSVFSVALSTKQGGGKSDRRQEAAQVSRQMLSRLKSYVTADPTTTAIQGPNSNNATNRWSLEDTTASPPIDCVGHTNDYALTAGTHTVTGILPGWLAAAPYYGTLKYYVGSETIGGQPAPQINVTVDWTEP